MKNNLLPIIASEVILGQPSIGCQGHGICKILTQSTIPSLHCPAVKTTISIRPDKKLSFLFQKSAMSKSAMEKHFGESLFQVTEAIGLPESLKRKFQNQRTQILPGYYPIIESNHFFMVLL